MAGKDRPPRAAWWASEIPWPLSEDARRDLITANKNFDAASRLDHLEREIVERVTEPRRLDVSARDRRAQIAEVETTTATLRATLRGLHPRVRAELLEALVLSHGWRADVLTRLVEALAVVRLASIEVRARIPLGGAPSEARRDRLIARVCGWVDSLQPLRSYAGRRAALSRNAARDTLHVPLRAPEDDQEKRRVDSVKIVLRALGLRAPRDVRAIVRKALK